MKKRLPSFLRLVLLFVPVAVLVAQTDHITAFTGTWKINKAKSNLPPVGEPQSFAFRMTKDGTTTMSIINGKGEPYDWSYPWSGGKEVLAKGIDNATVTQTIQDHTSDITLKIAGNTVMTAHAVVAADGKTQTYTMTNISPDGHRTSHTEFYDKQQYF